MFTSLPCLKFLFSHRHRFGLKRQMKKNAKMQDICNKETKTTAASLRIIKQPHSPNPTEKIKFNMKKTPAQWLFLALL